MSKVKSAKVIPLFRAMEFHRIAQKEAEKDRSDPWVYARTLCHLRTGVMTVADYAATE